MMGFSTTFLMRIFLVTSVMWMVDSMADSDPSKPDFDIWEDLLNNATKGGRDVTNQLTIFHTKSMHYLLYG